MGSSESAEKAPNEEEAARVILRLSRLPRFPANPASLSSQLASPPPDVSAWDRLWDLCALPSSPP